MRYEEKVMKKYLYFSDLQKALRGMNAMMYGVRKVFAASSAVIPAGTMAVTRSGDEVVLHSLKAAHHIHDPSPSKSKVSKQKVIEIRYRRSILLLWKGNHQFRMVPYNKYL